MSGNELLNWLERSIRQKSNFQMIPQGLIADLKSRLNSQSDVERHLAVHEFCALGITPVAGIECWPAQRCSDLQLAAAESLLREWLDCVEKHPEASEREIIRALFPKDESLASGAKVRIRRPKQEPARPSPLAKKLAAWSDKVKETLLDWDVCGEPNELAESDGQDLPLAPLDRKSFQEQMGMRLAEAWEHVTEILADARTDYELVAAEQSLHAVLATLRWEAIAVALELRDPEGERWTSQEVREIAASLEQSSQPTSREAKPTGDWVGKYRRMRAAGL